jgi:hypothetical protein
MMLDAFSDPGGVVWLRLVHALEGVATKGETLEYEAWFAWLWDELQAEVRSEPIRTRGRPRGTAWP